MNLDKTQKRMREFTRRAVNFRNDHEALRNDKYYNGCDNNNNGLKDITWLKLNAEEVDGSYLDNPQNSFLAFRIDGTEFNDSATSIYTALNKGDNEMLLNLPENLPNKKWYFIASTSEWSEDLNNFVNENKIKIVGKDHKIQPRSMMLFIEK